MSRYRSQIVAAMEELQEEETAAAVAEPEVTVEPEVTESVDAVAEQVEGSTDDFEQIDALGDDAEGLSDLGDAVAATVEPAEDGAPEGDGLSPEMADVVEVATEGYTRLMKRMGVKLPANPASETFKNPRDRKAQTRLAVENIKAWAKKAWDAIIAFFMKCKTWIVKFFSDLFDSNKRLEGAAKKIYDRADKIGDAAKAKAETISAGSFASKLQMGGKCDFSVVGNAVGGNTKYFLQVLQDVNEFAEYAGKIGASADSIIKNPAGASDKELPLKFLSTMKETGRENGMISLSSAELPGNRALLATVPQDWKKAAMIKLNVFGKTRVHFGTFDEKSKGFEGETVPTLTIQQVCDTTVGIQFLCNELDKRKSTLGNLSRNLDSMTAGIKKANIDNPGASDEAIRDMQNFMRQAGKVVAQLPTAFCGEAIRVAHAALDYSAKSLSQYGGKAEAAPAENK